MILLLYVVDYHLVYVRDEKDEAGKLFKFPFSAWIRMLDLPTQQQQQSVSQVNCCPFVDAPISIHSVWEERE